MIGPIVGGLLGGLGAAPASKVIHEGMDKLPHYDERYEQLLKHLPQEWQELRDDLHQVTHNLQKRPGGSYEYFQVPLGPGGGMPLHTEGHLYTNIFASSSFVLGIECVGIPTRQVNITGPGWNTIIATPGTQVWSTVAPVYALFYYSQDTLNTLVQ